MVKKTPRISTNGRAPYKVLAGAVTSKPKDFFSAETRAFLIDIGPVLAFSMGKSLTTVDCWWGCDVNLENLGIARAGMKIVKEHILSKDEARHSFFEIRKWVFFDLQKWIEFVKDKEKRDLLVCVLHYLYATHNSPRLALRRVCLAARNMSVKERNRDILLRRSLRIRARLTEEELENALLRLDKELEEVV